MDFLLGTVLETPLKQCFQALDIASAFRLREQSYVTFKLYQRTDEGEEDKLWLLNFISCLREIILRGKQTGQEDITIRLPRLTPRAFDPIGRQSAN